MALPVKHLQINPLNVELNPIWNLLALLGAHHILHVSRLRVKVNFNLNDFFFSHRPTLTKNTSAQINTLSSEHRKQRITRRKSILLHERTNCINLTRLHDDLNPKSSTRVDWTLRWSLDRACWVAENKGRRSAIQVPTTGTYEIRTTRHVVCGHCHTQHVNRKSYPNRIAGRTAQLHRLTGSCTRAQCWLSDRVWRTVYRLQRYIEWNVLLALGRQVLCRRRT